MDYVKTSLGKNETVLPSCHTIHLPCMKNNPEKCSKRKEDLISILKTEFQSSCNEQAISWLGKALIKNSKTTNYTLKFFKIYFQTLHFVYNDFVMMEFAVFSYVEKSVIYFSLRILL